LRISLFLLVFVSSAIFFGCSNQSSVSVQGNANSNVAVTAAQWNALTQSGKDMTIFSVALYSIGAYSPDCKDAMRTIVDSASGKVVLLPSTNSDGKSWGSSSHIINRNITNISNIGAMDIIQMYYYAPSSPRIWEPHTALVTGISGTTMTWIDGNFVATPPPPGTSVGTHTVTFAQFNSWINPPVTVPLAAKPPAGMSGGFNVYHVQ
jgi:hypothetical protein